MSDVRPEEKAGVSESLHPIENVVADFRAGKQYFSRTSDGLWDEVEDLRYDPKMTEKGGFDSDYILVATRRMESGRFRSEPLDDFLKLQVEAKESGVDRLVAHQRQARELNEHIDDRDTSMENKQRIFEARYKSRIAGLVVNELTGQRSDSRAREFYDDVQYWAKHPEEQSTYQGWKGSDFADLLRMFEQEEASVREQLLREFAEEGVDVEATKELIEKARMAQEKMKKTAERLRHMHGAYQEPRF